MADLAHELNRMLDRLQDDFQRLTDFASDLAHELRTPISNLLTQTQVVLASKRDAATYRTFLPRMPKSFSVWLAWCQTCCSWPKPNGA
jgi:two-component system heavy metal sensor histidine kinase CusS